jgi:hypothetical protein
MPTPLSLPPSTCPHRTTATSRPTAATSSSPGRLVPPHLVAASSPDRHHCLVRPQRHRPAVNATSSPGHHRRLASHLLLTRSPVRRLLVWPPVPRGLAPPSHPAIDATSAGPRAPHPDDPDDSRASVLPRSATASLVPKPLPSSTWLRTLTRSFELL